MRAGGFYPSELQVTEMLNEVTFNDDDGEEKSNNDAKARPDDEKRGEINMEQLIRLFINHRLVERMFRSYRRDAMIL